MVIIAGLFSLTSCTKEIIADEAIIYTDEPPKELWGLNEIYKETDKGFLSITETETAENKGYGCNVWFDQNTGEATYYQCGKWYLIPFKKYWGIKDGKLYVSKSTEMAAIFGETLLDVQDNIKRKTQTKVWVDFQGGRNYNPLRARRTITGLIQ